MDEQYQQPTDGTVLVYVGTYTYADSEGIHICRLDKSTGELKKVGVANNVVNPSFLTIDAKKQRLYAVNELTMFGQEPGGSVTSFGMDTSSGKLSIINRQYSHGGAPCYLTLDKTGRFLFAANYVGGNIAVFPINKDGVLGNPTDIVAHAGSSLHTKRQEAPHPHSIVLDSVNNYVFVADLGLDKIMQYKFDRENGRLLANEPPWTEIKLGSGPRHMIFHPTETYAYVINELSSTITAYVYDSITGTLEYFQTISTLPKGYSGENIAADLQMTPNGRFLLASNRGHDSLAHFAVDQGSGGLSLNAFIRTQGKTPRGFAIDPRGDFILVANQDSNNIVTFRIDGDSGTITSTGYQVRIPNPVCVKYAADLAS